MNIYDLDSNAEPAPWTVDDSAQPSWALHNNALDGEYYTNQEMANALMSAHCRNNFMKALGSLKLAAEILHFKEPGIAKKFEQDIKELETVHQ